MLDNLKAAKRAIPTIEQLRAVLSYDPVTGKLYWKERTPASFRPGNKSPEANCSGWNKKYAGKEALTANFNGYRFGTVLYKVILSHRVVWALVHGEWPTVPIDHINGDRADNRAENLRLADYLINSRNVRLRDANTSGHVGVSWSKLHGKWRAQIMVGGKSLHLGLFEIKQDAVEARKHASVKHGFHPNHGRAA